MAHALEWASVLLVGPGTHGVPASTSPLNYGAMNAFSGVNILLS